MRTTRLRITLREVEPPVTRVIDVPQDSTLPELHDLLQAALGWTDSHLHQFVDADKTAYGVAHEDDDWMEQLDEAKHHLRDLSAHFAYLYDLGDGWEHDVEVLGVGANEVGCVFGAGTCPPEDCGGPPGYERLLEALADPQDPEHDAMRIWAGDLRDFDRAETDLLVGQTVGRIPDSIRLVMTLAAGGVKLTPGGRLPRTFLRQVQETRPGWAYSSKPVSIEEDVLPLAALHELLRKVGLLRLRNGTLTPTKAAADDRHGIRRLRTWCDPGGFDDVLSTVSVGFLAAHGPRQVDDLAAAAHPFLGHRWGMNGRPMTVQDVKSALYGLRASLEGLDLVETRDGRTWGPGPSARTLIPGATALAHLWSRQPAGEAAP